VTDEPRFADDYSQRQTEAAHRVLIDLGQILRGFEDSVVVVGGWVPDLLLPDSSEEHVQSIDVDLALDPRRLADGRYAELLNLLFESRRYQLDSDRPFQLFTTVDLADGHENVRVDVDLLAPTEFKLKSTKQKLVEGFRIQQADGCSAAFRDPRVVTIDGPSANGTRNSVKLRIAALPDFFVMKCYALQKRDKPKDAYDICFCLENVGDGGSAIAAVWQTQPDDTGVRDAREILAEKFRHVDGFGPRQVADFRNTGAEDHAIRQRTAFELVRRFLAFF